MELHSERAAQHEGLSGVAVCCDFGGSEWVRLFVVMPRKPRTFGHQTPIIAFDGVTTDFRPIRATDSAAVCLRQQLPAEAHAENRHPGAIGLAQHGISAPTQVCSSAGSYADKVAPKGMMTSKPRGSGNSFAAISLTSRISLSYPASVAPHTSRWQRARSTFRCPAGSTRTTVSRLSTTCWLPWENVAGLSQRRKGDGVLFYAGPVCATGSSCRATTCLAVKMNFGGADVEGGLGDPATVLDPEQTG